MHKVNYYDSYSIHRNQPIFYINNLKSFFVQFNLFLISKMLKNSFSRLFAIIT